MATFFYSCLDSASRRGVCAEICAAYIYIYICDFAMGLRWAMRQPFLTRVKFLTQLLRLSMVFACFMYIFVGQQTRARQAGGSRRAFPAPEAMRRICARPFF